MGTSSSHSDDTRLVFVLGELTNNPQKKYLYEHKDGSFTWVVKQNSQIIWKVPVNVQIKRLEETKYKNEEGSAIVYSKGNDNRYYEAHVLYDDNKNYTEFKTIKGLDKCPCIFAKYKYILKAECIGLSLTINAYYNIVGFKQSSNYK